MHGSAPDIAGKGVADPIGQIWSASLMLDHLDEHAAAASVMRAIEDVLGGSGDRLTPDLGGTATTAQLGAAIADAVT